MLRHPPFFVLQPDRSAPISRPILLTGRAPAP